MTLELDWLKRWQQYSPEQVALQNGETGRTKTYRELFLESHRVAAHLRDKFGVAKGDRVACLAQNELEYLTLFFALQRLGAILVPVNFRFTAHEIQHILSDSGAKVLVVQSVYRASVSHLGVTLWSLEGEESLTEVAKAGGHSEVAFVGQVEDAVMILYTSGTTGFPKGAVISHRMLFWNSINTGLRLNLTQQDVVVTFLPLFHTGGWNVLTTPCLHRGAKVILLSKFEPERLLEICARDGVSILFGVPTTLDLLRRAPNFASTNLKSIRYAIVGGEPMPLDLIEIWEGRGIPIRQGYGLTEFGPNVFSLNEQDSRRKMGSIGFPNFYIEARVVDRDGSDVPSGEVGELILRGPVAMSGYWNQAEATLDVMREGWLYTGDLVRRDDEGYFFVVGRKKEMYISGGENVYPAEVEKVLRHFPGLREVAVVGVPDSKWGESGRAFLSTEAGRSVNVEALREYCREHLARFKIPKDFVLLPELPKTDSGKIAKQKLTQFNCSAPQP